jgi:NDP-mannose synthase
MSEGVFSLQDQLRARAQRRPVKAVVFAGGRGTRLAPYTSVLPKPLMPIGDRSILELVIDQLATYGITDLTLCVGYLSHLIEAVLDNCTRHHSRENVQITYVREEEALGTAAPLRLVEGLDSTFVAMNGDVLTTLDFNALIHHHRRSRNMLTIATRDRPIQIDYGVLHLGENGRQDRVEAYIEKPQITSTVSMGIYVLEPEVLRYVPSSGYFDFPALVQALLEHGEPVGGYRYDGLWFDIGRREDYEQAVSAWFEAAANGGSAIPADVAVEKV